MRGRVAPARHGRLRRGHLVGPLCHRPCALRREDLTLNDVSLRCCKRYFLSLALRQGE